MFRYFSIGEDQPSSRSEVNLHLRADVHASRVKLEAKPLVPFVKACSANDSSGRAVSASGIHTESRDGHTWTTEWVLDDPVSIPVVWSFANGNAGMNGGVTFLENLAGASVRARAFAGNVMRVISKFDGEETGTNLMDPGTRTVNQGGETTIDSSYTIQGGEGGEVAGSSGEFQWKTAKAKYPPKPNQAR